MRESCQIPNSLRRRGHDPGTAEMLGYLSLLKTFTLTASALQGSRSPLDEVDVLFPRQPVWVSCKLYKYLLISVTQQHVLSVMGFQLFWLVTPSPSSYQLWWVFLPASGANRLQTFYLFKPTREKDHCMYKTVTLSDVLLIIFDFQPLNWVFNVFCLVFLRLRSAALLLPSSRKSF